MMPTDTEHDAHAFVLEYWVRRLEEGQARLELLVTAGFESIAKQSGKTLDRVGSWLAAIAAAVAAYGAFHR